jgi:acylphosphatase
MIVEGLVQGVGFRWFAARKAEEFGVRGYVKNLYNGSVEIEAEGERGLLEDFIREMKAGPRAARVTNLHIDWQQNDSSTERYRHFEIR